MFKNPRRSRQARNFTTNVPKILDLKSSSEEIFFRKLSLGAPAKYSLSNIKNQLKDVCKTFSSTSGSLEMHLNNSVNFDYSVG